VPEALAGANGYDEDYDGDAFSYAFLSAQAAVAAVTEAIQPLEVGPGARPCARADTGHRYVSKSADLENS
jgi:hypothetical protein